MKKTLQLLAALLAASSLGVNAQDKAEAKPEAKPAAEAPKGDAPKKEDRPKVTPEERFKKLDKNGDGVLSFEEYRDSAGKKKSEDEVKEAFKKLDADGNGSVSLEEFKSPAKRKNK